SSSPARRGRGTMRRMVEGASITAPSGSLRSPPPPRGGGGTAPSASGMMIFCNAPGRGEGAFLCIVRGVMTDAEPHLLVVDYDLRLRELLRRYLSDSGFRVTGAADAAEARAQLASFAFDLVVLDVMMPGESGIELTRALRQRAAPRIPVLLLTAIGEPDDRVNGLEQGADDYLAKPFEPRELVLRIRNILQRRPDSAAVPGEVKFGTFRFDLARAELFRGGDPVHLTT